MAQMALSRQCIPCSTGCKIMCHRVVTKTPLYVGRKGFRRIATKYAELPVSCHANKADMAAEDPEGDLEKRSKNGIPLAATIAAVVGACIFAIFSTGTPSSLLDTGRHILSSSVLAKSGFFAAFSLIFASEVGDKTFFIAALLAMRFGKFISLVGSIAALSLMTVISVSIGYAVKSVPSVIKSSEVLGQWAGAALLVYFGIRTLRDALVQEGESGEELGEARESVEEAEKEGSITGESPLATFAEVATLIFVAEWGDRSMLATIALGAAQSPLGVAGGAIMGHVAATIIAVWGGAMLSNHISEKTVGIIGGVLFLVFAAATIFGFC